MRKPFSTSLEETLIKRAKLVAINQETSLNDILEKALKEYLDKVEKTVIS